MLLHQPGRASSTALAEAGAGVGRRRLMAGGCAVLAMLRPVGGTAEATTRLLQAGQLRIGTYFVNPPFEYVAGDKRVGFEVDLMQAVAERLRLQAVFIDTRWEIILREMQDNRYDCIIGGITITPNRERILAWSEPYLTTTLSLIVDTRRTPEAKGLADLKTATVGVQADTTDYDAAVAMHRAGAIGEVRVYPFARIADAMTDLAAGRIGTVMKVYPVAAWLTRKTPGLKIVAQVPNDPQPLGVGFNRNNPGLVLAVNRALMALKDDGRYKALSSYWGVV